MADPAALASLLSDHPTEGQAPTPPSSTPTPTTPSSASPEPTSPTPASPEPAPTAATTTDPAAPQSFASEPAKPAEATKEGDPPPEPAPAPVALTGDDIKIELPEGITLADEALGNFLTAANGAKLSKENAQALLKMHVGQVQSLVNDWVQAQTKTWNDTNEGWRNAIVADPVLGSGNESKTQEILGQAIDAYGDADLRAALDMTGAGNHPSIVRFIHKMASALTEGGIKPGGMPAPRGGPKGASLGERLYG